MSPVVILVNVGGAVLDVFDQEPEQGEDRSKLLPVRSLEGRSLREVAQFVAEKLATLSGVNSTATHFMLRSYKEHGFMLDAGTQESERLKVSP